MKKNYEGLKNAIYAFNIDEDRQLLSDAVYAYAYINAVLAFAETYVNEKGVVYFADVEGLEAFQIANFEYDRAVRAYYFECNVDDFEETHVHDDGTVETYALCEEAILEYYYVIRVFDEAYEKFLRETKGPFEMLKHSEAYNLDVLFDFKSKNYTINAYVKNCDDQEERDVTFERISNYLERDFVDWMIHENVNLSEINLQDIRFTNS